MLSGKRVLVLAVCVVLAGPLLAQQPKLRETLRNFPGEVKSIAFSPYSPDGKMVVSGCRDRTIKLWDVNTAELLATLKDHQATVSVVAFSPDGKMFASASEDKTVKLWDMARSEGKDR